MKIVKQIRNIHMECKPRYERLASEVRDVLKSRVEREGWFFFSRIKSDESFAQKIETGRVPDPERMEDFFACTIVVPTISAIHEAEGLVLQSYDCQERRPDDDRITRKESSSFRFDDLRLYVTRRPSASGKDPTLDGILFEVQIKTILQHAWSVATHDMIYKADTVSWPLERIAYQVKAMLEHAEIAITEAGQLSQASAVAKKDSHTGDILGIIGHIRSVWPTDQLPRDIKRLANNILELLRGCGVSVDKLPEIVRAEERRTGVLPKDLSPYAFTVQALAHGVLARFQSKLGTRQGGWKIVIHDDMDVPDWMRGGHPVILDLGSVDDKRTV